MMRARAMRVNSIHETSVHTPPPPRESCGNSIHTNLVLWWWLYDGGGGGCGCMAVVAVVVVVVAVVAVACKYENHPPNGTSPKYFPGEGSSLGLLGVYSIQATKRSEMIRSTQPWQRLDLS